MQIMVQDYRNCVLPHQNKEILPQTGENLDDLRLCFTEIKLIKKNKCNIVLHKVIQANNWNYSKKAKLGVG